MINFSCTHVVKGQEQRGILQQFGGVQATS